jgi:hypothetical protein
MPRVCLESSLSTSSRGTVVAVTSALTEICKPPAIFRSLHEHHCGPVPRSATRLEGSIQTICDNHQRSNCDRRDAEPSHVRRRDETSRITGPATLVRLLSRSGRLAAAMQHLRAKNVKINDRSLIAQFGSSPSPPPSIDREHSSASEKGVRGESLTTAQSAREPDNTHSRTQLHNPPCTRRQHGACSYR